MWCVWKIPVPFPPLMGILPNKPVTRAISVTIQSVFGNSSSPTFVVPTSVPLPRAVLSFHLRSGWCSRLLPGSLPSSLKATAALSWPRWWVRLASLSSKASHLAPWPCLNFFLFPNFPLKAHGLPQFSWEKKKRKQKNTSSPLKLS